MGHFLLPGNVYSLSESILITTKKYNELERKLEEFKGNVNSGIYTNILDFNFVVEKNFKSTSYEVNDKYFDSIIFFNYVSGSKLYSTIPLTIPNKECIDEKRWKSEKELDTKTLADKNKLDAAIDKLEWKKDKVGLLIINSRAYWLMRDGEIINYHDKLTKEIFGILDYSEPGFASLENYLSRIFEDSLAQFLQYKYGYFTQVRVKPIYLDGKEIDVFANKPMPKAFTVCECNFRLRNNPIILDELKSFNNKSIKIKQVNTIDGNEIFHFWLVTNSNNITSDVIEYAKQNNISIKLAKLHTNWQRRSDWSVTSLEEVI